MEGYCLLCKKVHSLDKECKQIIAAREVILAEQQLTELKLAILCGLGEAALKANLPLEEWQSVNIGYEEGTKRFIISVNMK